MSYIEGFDRNQAVLFPTTIDSMIASDNEVRFIDAFVDSLDLESMGFGSRRPQSNGRPAYRASDLLKLYIYGYMNRIRSSRALERECGRNIELMWLLRGLCPDHNTISNFRRDNPKAIKRVFRATVSTAQGYGLIGGVLLAGDGTRVRAQNSKKNNYNEKKIARHLSHIESRLEEYSAALASSDGDSEAVDPEKIAFQHCQRERYESLSEQLSGSGEKQVSTSDPDSRHLMVRTGHSEVCYNVQSTVDGKHCIPIDYKVCNSNDKYELSGMVRRAKAILGHGDFTGLYDKGYHNGVELQRCRDLGVSVLVSPPRDSAADRPGYRLSDMVYDSASDSYRCPAGAVLTTNGNLYNKNSGGYRSKQYKTKSCEGCALRSQCTSSKTGRVLERSEFADAVERNREFVESNRGLYKRRQQIVEHPFGTMKRNWGYDHVITKRGKRRAGSDIGLVFIAYNLRRLLSLVGMGGLLARLCSLILGILGYFMLVLRQIAVNTVFLRVRLIFCLKFSKPAVNC